MQDSGEWRRFIDRARAHWKDKFVPPPSNPALRHWFGIDVRVEIVSPDGWSRRGCITTTTGWQPRLMLIHRRGQHGSWDLLSEADCVALTSSRTANGKHLWLPVRENAFQAAVYRAQRQEET